MSSTGAHIRSSKPHYASPLLRRVSAGLLVAVLSAAPAALVVRAVVDQGQADQGNSPQVSRVVETRCLNGRVQQSLDTGRPDGLLLAHDTGVSC